MIKGRLILKSINMYCKFKLGLHYKVVRKIGIGNRKWNKRDISKLH